MTFLKQLEKSAVDGAQGLRIRSGKVVARNANGSFQVQIDGATYYQVWSQNGIDYGFGMNQGTFQTPVACQVVIDGFGRATLIP